MSSEKQRKARYALPAFCFLFTALIGGLLLSTALHIVQGIIAASWPQTTGTLIKSADNPGEVRYSYVVDGRKYESSEIHPAYEDAGASVETTIKNAQYVRVYYDKAHPGRCMLAPGFYSNSLGLLFVAFAFVAMGVMFLLITLRIVTDIEFPTSTILVAIYGMFTTLCGAVLGVMFFVSGNNDFGSGITVVNSSGQAIAAHLHGQQESSTEMFRLLSGPVYLLIYIVIIAAVIVRSRALISRDGSDRYPIPDHSSFDAFTLALLEGGASNVLRAASFGLVKEGLIEIEPKGFKDLLNVKEANPVSLHPIKAEICNVIRSSTTSAANLLTNPSLDRKIDTLSLPMRDMLLQARLLRTDEDVKRARGIKWQGLSIVLGLGLIKLYLDTTYNRPLGYLIWTLALSLPAFLILVKADRMTNLGRRYLDGLRTHFEGTIKEIALGNQPSGIDLTIIYVLFGISPFDGLAQYQAYSDAFHPKPSDSGSG